MDLQVLVHSEATTSPPDAAPARPVVVATTASGRTRGRRADLPPFHNTVCVADAGDANATSPPPSTGRGSGERLRGLLRRDRQQFGRATDKMDCATPHLPKSLKSLFSDHAHTTSSTASQKQILSEDLRAITHSWGLPLKFTSTFRLSSETAAAHEPRPLIQPRVPGQFVPSLPSELWLLILKYAAYPPFVPITPTATPAYPFPYPYPTTYDPVSEPVSFLEQPTAHTHRHERLAAYNAHLKAKAVLTRVCRVWNAIAQEVLYEFVWVSSAREGRAFAERLCGDGAVLATPSAVVSVGGREKEKEGGGKTALGRKFKGLLKHSPASSTEPSSTGPVVHRKSSSQALAHLSVGRFIKRLHVETPALDQCSPHDLLLILQHCPHIDEYCDYRSVRRPMHPLVLSLSDVAPFSISSTGLGHDLALSHKQRQQALLTPDALLHTLLSRPLKRLTWTNYEYNAADYNAGLRLYEDVVAPRLEAVGGKLEFLEIVLSGAAAYGMGSRGEVGWSVGGSATVAVGKGEETARELSGGAEGGMGQRGREVVLGKNPALGMYGAANMLTSLEASFTQTTTTFSNASPAFGSSSNVDLASPSASVAIDGFVYALCLPSLRSLKATLDNATFQVLSTWDMPRLTHLSVLSADFAYAGRGFRRFFEVHGAKLHQLELGHSSGDIEEAWLTDPPHAQDDSADPNDPAATDGRGPYGIPLEAWCPALKEFICSADAEWNWQTPDWIAPHVLLPAHSGVEFIGVRGMEKRLMNDLDNALRRRREDAGRAGPSAEDGAGARPDDTYFALLQQFGSLLRTDAFPALRYVRDMSWESDVMRRTGRMRPLPPSACASAAEAEAEAAVAPQPIPLERAHALLRPSPFGAAGGSASWWMGATPAGKKQAERLAEKRAAERTRVEGALERAYGLRLNGFWWSVLEMCRERGVWLEDCRGVNVTGQDLRRAARG